MAAGTAVAGMVGMAAAGTVAGAARASSAVRPISAVAAPCAGWFRPRGDRAGAWSTAATDTTRQTPPGICRVVSRLWTTAPFHRADEEPCTKQRNHLLARDFLS